MRWQGWRCSTMRGARRRRAWMQNQRHGYERALPVLQLQGRLPPADGLMVLEGSQGQRPTPLHGWSGGHQRRAEILGMGQALPSGG